MLVIVLFVTHYTRAKDDRRTLPVQRVQVPDGFADQYDFRRRQPESDY